MHLYKDHKKHPRQQQHTRNRKRGGGKGWSYILAKKVRWSRNGHRGIQELSGSVQSHLTQRVRRLISPPHLPWSFSLCNDDQQHDQSNWCHCLCKKLHFSSSPTHVTQPTRSNPESKNCNTAARGTEMRGTANPQYSIATILSIC